MLFGPDLRSLDQQIESFKGQITRDENAPGKPITGISFHRREFDFSFSSHSSRGFCDGDLATLRPSLEGLSELRDLDLAGTEITDQGLRHLKSLTQLKTLRVGSSRSIASALTKDAVLELQKDLPDTAIYFYERSHLSFDRSGIIESVCDLKSPPPARPGPVPAKGPKSAVKGKTSAAKKEIAFSLGAGVNLELVLIPAGEFLMGTPDAEVVIIHGKETPFASFAPESWDLAKSEKPQHRVRITSSFYLGKYKVTQEQWEALMGNNPSHTKGAKNPVEMVGFDDCQDFLTRLNGKAAVTKGTFTLPTEAQWEYACRAGSTTRYCFGDDASQLGEYAWYGKDSGGETHPVGQKKPNAWGLYDMHGRVGEWCTDLYGPYADGTVDDPSGPSVGWGRVLRGGLALDYRYCRSAHRGFAGLPRGRGGGSVDGLRVVFLPTDNQGAE